MGRVRVWRQWDALLNDTSLTPVSVPSGKTSFSVPLKHGQERGLQEMEGQPRPLGSCSVPGTLVSVSLSLSPRQRQCYNQELRGVSGLPSVPTCQ